MPSKMSYIVYTEPIGDKGEYKIYSVKTKEFLGTIKGENKKMYWEAFDTNNEFLMSGKRKKECMDYFREIDKKSRMAEGGGIDTQKNKKYSIEKLNKSIEDYLKENDILNLYFRVYDTSLDNVESYSIEPSPVTETKNNHLAGMQILWDSRENEFEVSEYQAGENSDELWVYGTYSSIIPAVKSLLKGNSETGRKRSPEYDESGIRVKNIKHGKGGGIGFEKLSKQVAKEYEGDKVAPEYQDEYGKTYSKKEAQEVGDKVAGKVYWQQKGRKFEEGGEMDDDDYEDDDCYDDDDDYATGGNIEAIRTKYAKKDISLVMKEGVMSIFGTKHGLLHLSYENGVFTITDNKYNPSTESYTVLLNTDNKEEAIKFIADSYVIEYENGGSMPTAEKTYHIVLEDGSKKEFTVKSPTEIVGIYFTMGYDRGSDTVTKGTPMVHFENALNPLLNEDGTPAEAMPQYAGKDYWDFKNKMANGGNTTFYYDQAKKVLGEHLYNHIASLNKEQLEIHLSRLQKEIERMKANDTEFTKQEFLPKYKQEEKFILYRLERLDEFKYAEGGNVENEEIELKFYNIWDKVVRSGKVNINYTNQTITLPSGKTFKVEPDYKYTYRILKNKIQAAGGIKGLAEFLKEINDPSHPLNSYVDVFIEATEMAKGGSVDEDKDYYRVFRNNAGKDVAVKIVKDPIFGKFNYYVDGELRGEFETFKEAREEVNHENFDMYKDGGNIYSKDESMNIARTILQQMGGRARLEAFTGAYNFAIGDGAVMFRIKNRGVNFVKVKLNGKDLYDVTFGRISGTNYKVVEQLDDIYAEDLIDVFERETGMYLRFEDGGMMANGGNIIEYRIKKQTEDSVIIELPFNAYKTGFDLEQRLKIQKLVNEDLGKNFAWQGFNVENDKTYVILGNNKFGKGGDVFNSEFY